MARGVLTLPTLLVGVSIGLMLGVMVIERTGRPVTLTQFADPAYIHWLGGLEEGDNHEFSSALFPSEITAMDLGYYRPEVMCARPPCHSYGEIVDRPREPETYEE